MSTNPRLLLTPLYAAVIAFVLLGPLSAKAAVNQPADARAGPNAPAKLDTPQGDTAPKLRGVPHWLARPTGDDFARAYPDHALRVGQQAHTTMICKVTAAGTLTACFVTEETPAGWGFASAALELAAKFRMSPTTDQGEPVEGQTVTIPIAWRLK